MNYDKLDLVILKTLISNKKYALEFVSENETDLFSTSLWNFAKVVIGYIHLYKELPTLRVIIERLSKNKNNANLVENIKSIWGILDQLKYDDREYKHDLERLKKRFAEEQILKAQNSLNKIEIGNIDIPKTVNELQKTIQNITNLNKKAVFENKTLKEALPQFVEKFNAKRENPQFEKGIKTGYSFLDYSTNLFKAADFTIIAGESGFGKSLFLGNCGVQVWMQDNTIDTPVSDFKDGKNVIYFSLEMPYEELFNRTLAKMANIPIRKIENASFNKEEMHKIKKCLDFINNYPYHFKIVDLTDASANDIENVLINCQERFDALFIDYLGIMHPNETKVDSQDWLNQSVVAYEVRQIARKYNIPVFSAAQLNRKTSKDSNEAIGLSRLARSSGVATHCTTVVQIQSREQEENYPDFIYHVIKSRKGMKGKGKLLKNLAAGTLIDVPLEADENNNYDTYFTDQDDISEDVERLEL